MPRSLFVKTPTPSSSDVAWSAAERRWSDDLHSRFARTIDVYVAIVDTIDPKFSKRITEAELERHGAGIAFLLDELRRFNLLDSLGLSSAPDTEAKMPDGEAR